MRFIVVVYLNMAQRQKRHRQRSGLPSRSKVKKVTSLCSKLVHGKVCLSPQQFSKLKRHRKVIRWLAACNRTKHGQMRAQKVIQKGGLLPILAVLGPLIAKAAIGGLATAAGAAISKAINNKKKDE